MAVWLPKHENTLIVKLATINLYDKMPYGGSRGEFYKSLRQPRSPLFDGFLRKNCGSSRRGFQFGAAVADAEEELFQFRGLVIFNEGFEQVQADFKLLDTLKEGLAV